MMNENKKYLCIHGHFYQPPRENAWLETVEVQDSAAPWHDWNERINFECYAPNAAARILDEKGQINQINNNYARISFNFGPTLLSWLETKDPYTYRKIQEADRLSQVLNDGHGSAIAQAHSHLILPLANDRDRETQVVWGIRDFEYRFGRKPEGMWAAETAVDTPTLETMAAHGIRYTILAPRQAKAIRHIDTATEWKSVNENTLNFKKPYLCKLPSGKSIILFFYNGDVSQEVAFKGLLNNGKGFAGRLMDFFSATDEVELVHIATDGETYGHHHRYGEMALADALSSVEQQGAVTLTNYGAFLEKFPPVWEAQIHENSSWSCVHGVERWRSNCGCHTGGDPGWNQLWRAPLRDTLNWLRDKIIPVFEQEASKLLKDPWVARDAYIDVLNDRSKQQVDAFMEMHAIRPLSEEETTQVLRLLEMQRHAMYMFTSCGWFFNEISGLETDQILQYANRAIHYLEQTSGLDLHEEFVARLAKAPSNVYENGAVGYINNVIPARVNLERVGMHFAASAVFEVHPEQYEFFNYIARSPSFERIKAGNQRLALGYTTVRSKITLSEKHFGFVALYLGQQHLMGAIAIDMSMERFQEHKKTITEAFKKSNLAEVIHLIGKFSSEHQFTMHSLFRDEKRRFLAYVTSSSLKAADTAYREIYNYNYQLMTALVNNDTPIPPYFQSAADYVLNADLRQFINTPAWKVDGLSQILSEMDHWKIRITDQDNLKLIASERLFDELSQLHATTHPVQYLQNINGILQLLQDKGVVLDFWKTQNLYFRLIKGYRSGEWVFVDEHWKAAFLQMGTLLKMRTTSIELV